ncbi:MAG: hypothetical protein ACI8PZ_004913 [Myxococcota bacterium]
MGVEGSMKSSTLATWLIAAIAIVPFAACSGGGEDSGGVSDTAAVTDTDTDTEDACPSDEHLEVISRHLDDLAGDATFALTHPGPRESVGFVSLPAWGGGPVNYFSLFMECADPLVFDAYCDGDLCWQTECIDPGRSWIQHGSINGAPLVRADLWEFTDGHASVEWIDDGSSDFTVSFDGHINDPAGADFSLTGTGTVHGEIMEVVAGYPGLVAGHATDVTATLDLHAGVASGAVTVDDTEVAVLAGAVGALRFEASPRCP